MTANIDIARHAALAGGEVLASRSADLGAIRTKGSASDFVTDVDIASGVAVARAVLESDPSARFVIEEDEVHDLANAPRGALSDPEVWVIDPLDGTTSFMHGYPCYSVSVALLHDGRPVAGAVHNAAAAQMCSAALGEGAWLDGRRLACAGASTIAEALLITGFPYDRTVTLDRQLRVLAHMLRTVHGIRRDGSAAIDLCHVAANRADGYWEFGLKPWDAAAGVLIVRESGGVVTDLAGAPWSVETAHVAAANATLHPVLLEAVSTIDRAEP